MATRSALVGRQAEREWLTDALKRAQLGQGALVLLAQILANTPAPPLAGAIYDRTQGIPSSSRSLRKRSCSPTR